MLNTAEVVSFCWFDPHLSSSFLPLPQWHSDGKTRTHPHSKNFHGMPLSQGKVYMHPERSSSTSIFGPELTIFVRLCKRLMGFFFLSNIDSNLGDRWRQSIIIRPEFTKQTNFMTKFKILF